MRRRKQLKSKVSRLGRVTLLLALTAVAVIAVLGAGDQQRTPPRENTAAEEIQPFAQIESDVSTSIKLNAQAQSLEVWHESGYTPEDIFANVRDLKSTEAWKTLCQALSKLSAEELALFENEIQDTRNQAALTCKTKLDGKLEQFWTKSNTTLSAMRQREGFKAIFPSARSLPLVEKHVAAEDGPVLTDGELKPGEIAITIDDGPHPTRTPRVLEILKNAGVRATFFQVGRLASDYPAISSQAAALGHSVGSHSWSHPQLTKLDLKHATQEIVSGHESVAGATGIPMPFFRFPYGARSSYLQQVVREQKLATFFWNMDSLDWKIRDPSKLYERVVSEITKHEGGIILFHDIHEQTVLALPHVLDELRARNFTTVVFVPH